MQSTWGNTGEKTWLTEWFQTGIIHMILTRCDRGSSCWIYYLKHSIFPHVSTKFRNPAAWVLLPSTPPSTHTLELRHTYAWQHSPPWTNLLGPHTTPESFKILRFSWKVLENEQIGACMGLTLRVRVHFPLLHRGITKVGWSVLAADSFTITRTTKRGLLLLTRSTEPPG